MCKKIYMFYWKLNHRLIIGSLQHKGEITMNTKHNKRNWLSEWWGPAHSLTKQSLNWRKLLKTNGPKVIQRMKEHLLKKIY